jgi:hypothetical protein
MYYMHSTHIQHYTTINIFIFSLSHNLCICYNFFLQDIAPAAVLSLQPSVGGVTPRADDCLEGWFMAHCKDLDEGIPNHVPFLRKAQSDAEDETVVQTSPLVMRMGCEMDHTPISLT